jgi:hypothetical protein
VSRPAIEAVVTVPFAVLALLGVLALDAVARPSLAIERINR